MQPLLILFVILAIGLFGGSKGAVNNGLISNDNGTPVQQRTDNEQKIIETQNKIDDLKVQLQIEEDKKNSSVYKGDVTLSNITRSSNPGQEYMTIKVSRDSKKIIPVTGWILKSLSSGNSVSIPKATYLFFAGTINSEENIMLQGGDTLYLITGTSPNGTSFKLNKCSGYMGQFQNFTPYLRNNCPYPRNEDLSSIPDRVINDACLDYIYSYPACRTQTEPLPQNWSTECKSFINDKINYPNCINTHKSDKDFYEPEWRVYLKRSERLWKDSRETIVLYDAQGKVVDILKY